MANTEEHDSCDIIEFLYEAGFCPNEENFLPSTRGDWYDCGNVRVVEHKEGWWEIIVFSGEHNQFVDYEIKFGVNTPYRIIVATIREILK